MVDDWLTGGGETHRMSNNSPRSPHILIGWIAVGAIANVLIQNILIILVVLVCITMRVWVASRRRRQIVDNDFHFAYQFTVHGQRVMGRRL